MELVLLLSEKMIKVNSRLKCLVMMICLVIMVIPVRSVSLVNGEYLNTTNEKDVNFAGPNYRVNIANREYIWVLMPPLNLFDKYGLGIYEDSTTHAWHDTFSDWVILKKNGNVEIQGEGNLGSNPIYFTSFVYGSLNKSIMYFLFNITNEGDSNLNLSFSFKAEGWNLKDIYDTIGVNCNDSISWNDTLKSIIVKDNGINNLFIGFTGINATHYFTSNGWVNDLDIMANNGGNLTNENNCTKDSGCFIWVQTYSESEPLEIPAGESKSFVYFITYGENMSVISDNIDYARENWYSDYQDYLNLINRPSPTITTPNENVSWLYSYLIHRASIMSRLSKIDNLFFNNAGAYSFFGLWDRDSYYGELTSYLIGDEEIIKNDYVLMKNRQDEDYDQMHEIKYKVNSSGLYVFYDNQGDLGDSEAYQIMRAYLYFLKTHNTSFLNAEIDNLNHIGDYILSFKNEEGLLDCATYTTYEEFYDVPIPGITPYQVAILSSALKRLSELNEFVGNYTAAQYYLNESKSLRNKIYLLWNDTEGWFNYCKNTSYSVPHKHAEAVDAILFDAVNETVANQMADTIISDTWWNETHKCYNTVPTDDSWFNSSSYWRDGGWHVMDFKLHEAMFRYGNKTLAWNRLIKEVNRIINNNTGNPGEKYTANGLFIYSSGSYVDMMNHILGIYNNLNYLLLKPSIPSNIGYFNISNYPIYNVNLSLSCANNDQTTCYLKNQNNNINKTLKLNGVTFIFDNTTYQISRLDISNGRLVLDNKSSLILI